MLLDVMIGGRHNAHKFNDQITRLGAGRRPRRVRVQPARRVRWQHLSDQQQPLFHHLTRCWNGVAAGSRREPHRI